MNLRVARRAGGFGGMLRKGDVTECIISMVSDCHRPFPFFIGVVQVFG